MLHSKRQLTPGQDPAYVSVPYASFAAGQTAVQGILAALFERESSGLGQVVEANLVSGVGALDTYNWFYEMILRRYPDAFKPLADAFDDRGQAAVPADVRPARRGHQGRHLAAVRPDGAPPHAGLP